MQLINGSWTGNIPTPGEENQISSGGDEDNEEEDNSDEDFGSSSPSTSNTSNQDAVRAKLELKITAPKTVFTNIPFELSADANWNGGKYFWNFGDGNYMETNDSDLFSYTYLYEGEYAVTVEYYPRSNSQEPVSAKTTIKAVPMEVSISRVGEDKDFFIELSNNTGYEVDISGWKLFSTSKNFIFPKYSAILPRKKMILSSKITGFDFADKNSLQLSNKEGELVYNYNYGGLPAADKKSLSVNSPKIGNSEPIPLEETETSLKESNSSLPALPIQALSDNEGSNNAYIYIVIFIALVGGSAGAVYFIRRKGINASTGDDFELLD